MSIAPAAYGPGQFCSGKRGRYGKYKKYGFKCKRGSDGRYRLFRRY